MITEEKKEELKRKSKEMLDKAGDDGAIVSEFSSQSIDEKDVFTDPDIVRVPEK